jgi:hypothetical protein
VKRSFVEKVRIIDINPYVRLPKAVLAAIFESAGRAKSPIPVKGTLNGKPFRQTLVRYQGAWRLYLNAPMRLAAGVEVGDQASLELSFDPRPRVVPMHPKLARALAKSPRAAKAFERLTPSHQKEIKRYLASLKSEETRERNIGKVILYLMGEAPPGLAVLMRRRRR